MKPSAGDEIHPASLAKLVRSIALLALAYEDQLVWLRSLGLGEPTYADELAHELDDGALLIRQFEARGWVSATTSRAVDKVNSLLAVHGGTAEDQFWSLAALKKSDEWARIRLAARDALITIE